MQRILQMGCVADDAPLVSSQAFVSSARWLLSVFYGKQQVVLKFP